MPRGTSMFIVMSGFVTLALASHGLVNAAWPDSKAETERENAELVACLEIAETALKASSREHEKALEDDGVQYRPVRLQHGKIKD